MIILAIDALEYELVKKFECKSLMQDFYGKTNIEEFTEPRNFTPFISNELILSIFFMFFIS